MLQVFQFKTILENIRDQVQSCQGGPYGASQHEGEF